MGFFEFIYRLFMEILGYKPHFHKKINKEEETTDFL